MKNNRKIYISIGVILLVMSLLTAFAFRQKAQTNDSNQNYQQDVDDEPTVIKRGQTTEKEKVYSRKYRNYTNPKYRITEGIRLAEQQGFNGVIDRTIITEPNTGFTRLNATEFLRYLACSSDAIIFGSPTSKTAHLTEDESWVYTEYDFLVKEILKNNSIAPTEKGQSIQVTRTGGLIKLDNYTLRFKNDGIQQLKRNKDYLLFLRFVPETNGYMVASMFGDFIFEGNRFNSLSKTPIPKKLIRDSDFQTLLNNVFNATRSGCHPPIKGGNNQ
jgi:hypothetical protein